VIIKQLLTMLVIMHSMRGPNTKINYQFILEKLLSKKLNTEFVIFNNQLADVLTKSLSRYWFRAR